MTYRVTQYNAVYTANKPISLYYAVYILHVYLICLHGLMTCTHVHSFVCLSF